MTLHRKHILTMGPQKNPRIDTIISIDEEFVETLKRNFFHEIPGYVPVLSHSGRYPMDPGRALSEVVSVVTEGDKVMVEFEYTGDLNLRKVDAYPMLHLSYIDTRTGDPVGPVLIHVLLKPRPVVVSLPPFENNTAE